ncbi:MAG: VOC family protein [Planctomycetes bacterium]|nr:VOC family protein [Planctomycetota bacterium]
MPRRHRATATPHPTHPTRSLALLLACAAPALVGCSAATDRELASEPLRGTTDAQTGAATDGSAAAIVARDPAAAARFWADVLWLEIADEDGATVVRRADGLPVLRFVRGQSSAATPIAVSVGDLDVALAGLAARRWPFEFDAPDQVRFVDPDGRRGLVTTGR